MIEVITNSGIKYEEGEEVVDVCQAIQEMRMESEQKGRLEGRLEGKLEGKLEGEQEGRLMQAKEAARNFYRLGVDIEKVAQGVGYAVETVKQWLGLLDEPS